MTRCLRNQRVNSTTGSHAPMPKGGTKMPNLTNGFDWTSRQADLNTLVKETSKEIRISRPIFKPWGQPNTPVYAHKVTSRSSTTGPSLSVDPNQLLKPIQLSCQFGLFPEQFN